MTTALRLAIQQAREQHRAGNGSALDALLRTAFAARNDMAKVLPQQAGVAMFVVGTELQPDFSQWSKADAVAHRCVVLADTSQRRWLAAEDPWDESSIQRVNRRVGASLPLLAVRRGDFEGWVGDAPGASRQANALLPTVDAALQADGPIVAFVHDAIRAAYRDGASDIHFECDRSGVTVKFRLDGVMSSFARLEGSARAQEAISRIKVLAQLDITERRLPQDGRFRYQLAEGSIDLRVSVMPSIHGEDIVLRLLDKAQLRTRDASVTLGALGFDAPSADRIRELAERPNGMLLVTGPTGSGKTTTIYAVLSEINTGLEKIITIEDPVEYELPQVLQIPVNERKGLTFAKGLRSILRHDPDRILVGEIRDAETAEIAVQSALTGHLVFTTVHANGMADIMGRFRHFGLDMFGFMSSLNGVVVQRLVRQLCSACCAMRPPTERERGWLTSQGFDAVDAVPSAVGCAACHGSGYGGRFVIAEIHEVDDSLRDAVTEGAPVSEVRRLAQQRAGSTLLQLSAQHVARGRTTMEEVKRVVGWQ
ncbi:GspE/PulE family protein [Variovorax sp. YR752]|uniref:GspE/PulE family protein n=1 Tax=Variovorax sp. YR752 TaxID=1884383 RepID=UPI003137EFB8